MKQKLIIIAFTDSGIGNIIGYKRSKNEDA